MKARVLGAAIVLAVLAGACGDDGESASTSTSSTTTTEASTTTTDTTLFIYNDEPPELRNTGEDFEAIYISIHNYATWLEAHPSLELIDRVAEPGSPTHEAFTTTIGDLVANDLSNRSNEADTPTDVRVLQRLGADRVVIFATLKRGGFRKVDSDGQVVESQPARDDLNVSIELSRVDGAWRLVQLTPLESAE